MHRFDQGLDIFRRSELGNAVTEVENMPGRRLAIAVEHFASFADDLLRRGKQNAGVEVALQGDAVADATTGFADIDRPIDPDGVATAVGDRFQS